MSITALCVEINKKQTRTKSFKPNTVNVENIDLWQTNNRVDHLSDIGRGKAIIYSPDLSAADNREFYDKLGFSYFEDANWLNIINQIREHNVTEPNNKIEVLIFETHGTNGNGLKVQTGPKPEDARSYISIGALQERLNGSGVRFFILAACNAGRLLRPEIYKTLIEPADDPLFLPANNGVINCSKDFDPSKSSITVLHRADSHLETTTEGETSELSPLARKLITSSENNIIPVSLRTNVAKAQSLHFAVSDLLIQMLLHDKRLHLSSNGYDEEKSRDNLSDDQTEELFAKFLVYVDHVASNDFQLSQKELAPRRAHAPANITSEINPAILIP